MIVAPNEPTSAPVPDLALQLATSEEVAVSCSACSCNTLRTNQGPEI